MHALPLLDLTKRRCASPHVVILGAGASRAALPHGDAEGRKVPLMNEIPDAIGLTELLADEDKQIDFSDFEAAYDDLVRSGTNKDLVESIERRIRSYFSGLTLPQRATVYDFLLLSLREQDVVATFNWDPLLPDAYRRNARFKRLPRMLFLHGNVATGFCEEHRTKGYLIDRCRFCRRPFTPSKLLYPVRDKDYTSHVLIANEWEELQDTLHQAYLLTIFGYAAPATDVKAREMLLDTWSDNPLSEVAQINIIDPSLVENSKQTGQSSSAATTSISIGSSRRLGSAITLGGAVKHWRWRPSRMTLGRLIPFPGFGLSRDYGNGSHHCWTRRTGEYSAGICAPGYPNR